MKFKKKKWVKKVITISFITIICSISVIVYLLQANSIEIAEVQVSSEKNNIEFEVDRYARYIKFEIESSENKTCELEIANPLEEIVISKDLSENFISFYEKGEKGIWNISFKNIEKNSNMKIKYRITTSNFKSNL